MEADASGVALVADGENAVRLLARVALESAGWKVVEAASRDEATQRGLAASPRVAVLDVGIDGFDVATALAANPATKDAAIIFVSASSEAKRRADKVNAMFLSKPFNPSVLVSMVEQAAQSSWP